MKKAVLSALILFTSFNLFAQTKRIAHRSHSGKNSTIILTTEDNFGNPNPDYYKRRDSIAAKKADTVTKKQSVIISKRKTKKLKRKEK